MEDDDRPDLAALVHKLTRFGQTYSVGSGKCKINAGSTSYGESYLAG